jgi:hypothetical protein
MALQRWLVVPLALSSLNLALYLGQGVRLAVAGEPNASLVAANFVLASLYAVSVLLLRMAQLPAAIYSTVLASIVTARMLDAALDPLREPLFRASHAGMIVLAWLVPLSTLGAVYWRSKRVLEAPSKAG